MTDDTLAAFMHGLTRLHVDDDQLIGEPDPADTAAILALANQLTDRATGDTVHALAVDRLAVLTAALITGHKFGIGRKGLGRDWLLARAELLTLKLAAG